MMMMMMMMMSFVNGFPLHRRREGRASSHSIHGVVSWSWMGHRVGRSVTSAALPRSGVRRKGRPHVTQNSFMPPRYTIYNRIT